MSKLAKFGMSSATGLAIGLSIGLTTGLATGLAIGLASPGMAQDSPFPLPDDLKMPLPQGVGTCKDHCPAKGIQFKPGQRIKVRIVNRTKRYISIEKVAGTNPVILSGLKALEFNKGGESDTNPSIVLWEKNETPLRVQLSQPKPDVLLVEVRFAAKKPGDQSIYLRNDGLVDVF
jgi:hypothetical protein